MKRSQASIAWLAYITDGPAPMQMLIASALSSLALASRAPPRSVRMWPEIFLISSDQSRSLIDQAFLSQVLTPNSV